LLACLLAGWLLLHKFNGHLETFNSVAKTGLSKTQCTLMPGQSERDREREGEREREGAASAGLLLLVPGDGTLESRVSGVRD
jgi:hypothetical protein